MTYQRSSILEDTIMQITQQSYPPEKILIVDNSQDFETEELIRRLENPRLEYQRVGYNAGPAGAARIGLKQLTEEGFQWVYWGDDNDPPDFEDAFEVIFGLIDKSAVHRIGIVGAVGHYFDKRIGNIIRVSNEELGQKDVLEVDSIAGGMSMIINTAVVHEGILPNAKLFFGFEELEFCFQVTRHNYKLLVSTDLYRRSREKYKRQNLKKTFYSVKTISSLWRQYYSVRNLLWILRSNRFYLALFYQTIKGIGKALYGFRYGIQYGSINFIQILKGIWHGLTK